MLRKTLDHVSRSCGTGPWLGRYGNAGGGGHGGGGGGGGGAAAAVTLPVAVGAAVAVAVVMPAWVAVEAAAA